MPDPGTFTSGLQAPVDMALAGLFALQLFVAMWYDIRERRIPNAVNGMLLLSGVLVAVVAPLRVTGALDALLGVAVGFGIWIVFYVFGVLGAGDVKFFAAASSWLGPTLSWKAALITGVVGGLLAVGFLWRDSRLGKAMRSLALMPFLRSVPRVSIDEMEPAVARRQLPYGVAMAAGAAVAFWYPQVLGG